MYKEKGHNGNMETYNWPYGNELGEREEAACDVLVLGGGLAVMQPLQQPEEGSLLFWWKRAIQSTVVQPEPDLTTGSQHVPIPALR